jgi:hypothetical protein
VAHAEKIGYQIPDGRRREYYIANNGYDRMSVLETMFGKKNTPDEEWASIYGALDFTAVPAAATRPPPPPPTQPDPGSLTLHLSGSGLGGQPVPANLEGANASAREAHFSAQRANDANQRLLDKVWEVGSEEAADVMLGSTMQDAKVYQSQAKGDKGGNKKVFRCAPRSLLLRNQPRSNTRFTSPHRPTPAARTTWSPGNPSHTAKTCHEYPRCNPTTGDEFAATFGGGGA